MKIQDLLLDTNHLVQQFIMANDNLPSVDLNVVTHTYCSNVPVVSEVTAVISGHEHWKQEIVTP